MIERRGFSFKNKIPLLLLAICGVLGSMSYEWIVENKTRYLNIIGVDKLFLTLKEIYEILYMATTDSPISALIFLLYTGIVLHTFIQLVRGEKKVSELSWLIIFSFPFVQHRISVDKYACLYQIFHSRFFLASHHCFALPEFLFSQLFL